MAFASNQTDVDVKTGLDDGTVLMDVPVGVKEINITQDNYDDYFNKYTGEIKQNANINKGDILQIGNVSDRCFVIDRQLTLKPINDNDQISNGFIHLIKGSDGSTVTGLTINNTKSVLTINSQQVGYLHGIWLSDSSYHNISYNVIRIANSGGVYAMPMHSSSYNRIVYNDMKTYISSNIIMSLSHYNLISHNNIEVLSYSDQSVTNLIYFSPFAFAGRIDSPLCIGNTISYNNLIGYCSLPMSIIIQAVYADNINTTIANNTIYKGSFGVNLLGENALVYGNIINESAVAISVSGKNISIYDNDVVGDSLKQGITAIGDENGYGHVYDNHISFTDITQAMHVGNYIEAYDNNIDVKDYGNGIAIIGNHSSVHDNKVKTSYDNGIVFLGNNNTIDNNIIVTNACGISINTQGTDRYYNNTIKNNKITSDRYGIYLNGLAYYSIISSNVIETNASVGIYKSITDEIADNDSDNIINGVIYDATALTVDDANFYEYFDKDGYLTYSFKEGRSKTIFFTFLTNKDVVIDQKINIISNKMNNLLFNVTIKLTGDASGSLVRDFNFVNNNKAAIILDAVDDVSIINNNITVSFTGKNDYDSAIFACGVGDDNVISNNNIYVNSKIDYAYGISVSSYNPNTYLYNKLFSKGYKIENNTIIMITKGMGEAIFSDMLVESDIVSNKINIISDASAYGIASVNVIGRPHSLNISDNYIVVHCKKMAYLIELHMSDDVLVENNYLYAESNGVYGIVTYMANNISINNNEINVFGGDLSLVNNSADVVGIGIGPIFISKFSNSTDIINNIIYANSNPFLIDNLNSTVTLENNSYVISNFNYDIYSNLEFIHENDTLVLTDLTDNQLFNIDVPLKIKGNNVNIRLIINNNVTIENISFINSSITLNNVSGVLIKNTNLNFSEIILLNSSDNVIFNNTLIDSIIEINNSNSNIIESNIFNTVKNEVITVNASKNNNILNNNFTANSKTIIFINNLNSNNTIFDNNVIKGKADEIYGYVSSNSHFAQVLNNFIVINGTINNAAILLTNNSSNNLISNNMILSYSLDNDDYAVVVMANENMLNKIIENYLISSNGLKRANEAVLDNYDLVVNNTPYDIYVAVTGSDVLGDGSSSNPFKTIWHALKNSLNHAIIHVGEGIYIESDLTCDRNITLIGNNAIIDANLNQLFKILNNGILTINGFTITNGHNVEGGSLFINNGTLIISNSTISNSSSYFDNSNPVFDQNISQNHAYTHDCRNEGLGGAILNYGNLIITDTVVYGNFAHIGGAIADFGKLSIGSSLFYANKAVHGGAIYTDSDNTLEINNTIFYENLAVITLNYCMVDKATSGWSIGDGYSYSYYSMCNIPVGGGGAIYSKSTNLNVENSLFNKNSAWKGGAIATPYISASQNTNPKVLLVVNNCSFINNRANNTKLSSDLLNSFNYNSDYHGGAIYGAFSKFYLNGSKFISNQAENNGGALYVQSADAFIDLCSFIANRAGITGGALYISNNFLITRTIISNNSALYGGAINYDSYYYYGHVQNNLNIYNSTISDNLALNSGGAFRIGQANITVHNSNIYNNFAPEGSTISSSYITSDASRVSADFTRNYWGSDSNGRANVADDSVYNFPNVKVGNRLREFVNWYIVPQDGDGSQNIPSNPDSGNNNQNHYIPVNPGNTNSNTGTNINIGGNSGGTVVGPSGSPTNTGTNPGPGGTGLNPSSNGQYSNTISNVNSLPFGTPKANNYYTNPSNSDKTYWNTSNSANNKPADSLNNGSVDENSLSRQNSSQFNAALDTVGLTANAIQASSSSSDSEGQSSEGGEASGSSESKAYELEDRSVEKKIDEDKAILSFVFIAIITMSLLIFGYKREENDENN